MTKPLAVLVGLLVVAATPVSPQQQPASPRPVYDAALLTAGEKHDILLALDVQRRLGDEVWPGFWAARNPVLVYNDVFDFLVGVPKAPEGWEAVQDDDLGGEPYWRRKSAGHSAFAVKVGDQWAGSMSSRQRFGRDIAPMSGVAIGEDYYAAVLLHEMFHAYQARTSQKRFQRALATYGAEKDYPYQDKAFAQAWTQEGAALAAAVETAAADTASETARRFLSIRDTRRRAAVLSGAALDFERELEWLEGLGKYAETRFYDLAAKDEQFAAGNRFRPNRFHWSDGMLLKGMLGSQRGDLRFYLSGNAQARLLDRLAPGWKTHAMDDGVYLEDLLRKAAAPTSDR